MWLACFLALRFDVENLGSMFLRKVSKVYQNAQPHIPEYRHVIE
jgi:hypothetical protein